MEFQKIPFLLAWLIFAPFEFIGLWSFTQRKIIISGNNGIITIIPNNEPKHELCFLFLVIINLPFVFYWHITKILDFKPFSTENMYKKEFYLFPDPTNFSSSFLIFSHASMYLSASIPRYLINTNITIIIATIPALISKI